MIHSAITAISSGERLIVEGSSGRDKAGALILEVGVWANKLSTDLQLAMVEQRKPGRIKKDGGSILSLSGTAGVSAT